MCQTLFQAVYIRYLIQSSKWPHEIGIGHLPSRVIDEETSIKHWAPFPQLVSGKLG